MKSLFVRFSLKICSLLFPLFCFGEILEVALPTSIEKASVYLTKVHVHSSEYDWRYCDELRQVLAFDLNHNGFSSVLEISESLEESLSWPDVRSRFNVSFWKKGHVSYVCAAQIVQNRLQLTVFNVQKESSKKYPDVMLTGKLEVDRTELHRLADAVQKDLFGVEGIASLKILYSHRSMSEDGWDSEIWMCDADGANTLPLVQQRGYCVSPGFFPGKDGFYYVSFQGGQSKIYRSSGEELVLLRGSQALPSMNAQGTQIAFITDVAGRPDLFIQNLDSQGKMVGKARQLFSAPRATQASPTYSPDGKQIAFVSDKDGVPRIYVLEILGSKATQKIAPRLLTKMHRENTSPAWSPDGSKIAYSAKVDGVRQIWLYDLALQTESPITTGSEHKENPVWAPDNHHLIYNTESDDRCELYRVHIVHKESIQISSGPGLKRFPSW